MSEKIYKGYKATDKDIKCRDYQFTVGEWHEHQGEVKLCESGFHFCPEPSGPWCYYSEEGTRVWEIEATEVIEDDSPGADRKFVAKRIRLVREIIATGDRNTGDCNTGDYNTGNRNTGDYNTGDRNTGDYNTGNRNTGDYNTGNGNTGYRNTGDYNTGYYNTGYYNTGDCNTGDCNTGNYNLASFSSGYFAIEEPNAMMFGCDTGVSRQIFLNKFRDRFPNLFVAMKSNQVAKEIAITFGDIPCVTEENVQRWKDKYNQLYGE
jgi:hypothetical protein